MNEIRKYASGVQDLAKYKKVFLSGVEGVDYIKIRWKPKGKLKKLLLTTRQKIKCYKMISRLKLKSQQQ